MGDNTGGEVVMLEPIRFQAFESPCFSWTSSCIHIHLTKCVLNPNFLKIRLRRTFRDVPIALVGESLCLKIGHHNFFPILTFISTCIANIFSEYNQQDVMFPSLIISIRRSTCFRRFFRPSSAAQNCTYSVRHLSDQYCYLLLALTG